MKLHELIDELQKLSSSHPNANLRFECVTYIGNGTSTTEAGFVDAKIEGVTAIVRVTVPPFDVEKVRACGDDT